MHQLTSPGWRLVEKASVSLILPLRSVHLHPLCGHADSSSGRRAGSRICSFSVLYSVFHVSVFHEHHWSHQHHLSCSLCFYSKLKEGGECGSWLCVRNVLIYKATRGLYNSLYINVIFQRRPWGLQRVRGSQFPVRHAGETQASCLAWQASNFSLQESELSWVRLSCPGQVRVPWVCCWSRHTSVNQDAVLIEGTAAGQVC